MKSALTDEIETLVSTIALTDRQKDLFDMKYRRGLDINFIADSVGLSPDAVNKELKKIRKKIARAMGL